MILLSFEVYKMKAKVKECQYSSLAEAAQLCSAAPPTHVAVECQSAGCKVPRLFPFTKKKHKCGYLKTAIIKKCFLTYKHNKLKQRLKTTQWLSVCVCVFTALLVQSVDVNRFFFFSTEQSYCRLCSHSR